MSIECSHTIIMVVGEHTKCGMCKSFLKYVDGKHVVVDVEETEESKKSSEYTDVFHKKMVKELGGLTNE